MKSIYIKCNILHRGKIYSLENIKYRKCGSESTLMHVAKENLFLYLFFEPHFTSSILGIDLSQMHMEVLRRPVKNAKSQHLTILW